MKKVKIAIFVLAALLVSTGTRVYAENIGFIDMERLFANFKEGKDAQADLIKRREEFQKLAEEKQKSIEDAKKDKKSDEEIQKLTAKVEGELRPKQEEILQHESEVQGRIVLKIKEITKMVAKRFGITVTLDRRAIFDGGLDLTEFVVEKLNAGDSAAAKTEKAPARKASR